MTCPHHPPKRVSVPNCATTIMYHSNNANKMPPSPPKLFRGRRGDEGDISLMRTRNGKRILPGRHISRNLCPRSLPLLPQALWLNKDGDLKLGIWLVASDKKIATVKKLLSKISSFKFLFRSDCSMFQSLFLYGRTPYPN